jgi:hypothetical protein
LTFDLGLLSPPGTPAGCNRGLEHVLDSTNSAC